jgi:hypothetical protein
MNESVGLVVFRPFQHLTWDRRAVAATRVVGADPSVLGEVGVALGAASYLGTWGLLLLPIL